MNMCSSTWKETMLQRTPPLAVGGASSCSLEDRPTNELSSRRVAAKTYRIKGKFDSNVVQLPPTFNIQMHTMQLIPNPDHNVFNK